MIIRQVELTNFGIYSGQQLFNLTPTPLDGFNRPVVLISGNNGTGKTTLVEAIRLCLHGPLSLGTRVSQVSYESYLAGRIHVPRGLKDHPAVAKVGVILDYVSAGRRQVYRIERHWNRAKNRVDQDLRIWENDKELADLETVSQKDAFLRELLPPHVADLYILDGEKIQMMAEDAVGTTTLTHTIKTLLGFQLLEQLQKDLDVHIALGLDGQGLALLTSELEQVTRRVDELRAALADRQAEQDTNRHLREQTHQAIAAIEQQIAQQGKWFAGRLESLKADRQRLEIEVEVRLRQLQELSALLMPFAVCPGMCQRVAERLVLEKEFERVVTSQQIVTAQLEQFVVEINSSQFWSDIGLVADEQIQQRMISKIEALLRRTVPSVDTNPSEVILHVSDQERDTLLAWIQQALSDVPQQFCQVVNELNLFQSKIRQLDREVELVPPDETIGPLVERLNEHNQEMGKLRKQEHDLSEQIQHIEYEIEQANYQLRRVRQQIGDHEHLGQRIQLATRTQHALEEYAQELSRDKTALLERALIKHFNELSRKDSLIDSVSIDPTTFGLTLFRARRSFERSRLSAGEKQVLAVAMIWALREVSGVPMPVIIDTPLGRLDSEHRFNMIQDYFPRASHQVVLLATDSELSNRTLSGLTPAISRVYSLTYDSVDGRTDVSESRAADIFTARELSI